MGGRSAIALLAAKQKWILLTIAVVATFVVRTSSADSAVCSAGCPAGGSGNSKLKFVPGQQYNYDFESTVTITLVGSYENNVKTAKIRNTVELYAEDNCKLTIKLLPDKKDPNKKAHRFTQNPVRFTLSNDELSAEICADAKEPTFDLNIKRSIISLFQLATEKTYETDIFGTCPTVFTQSSSKAGQETVSKIRNLNACGHRESFANGLISGILNENSGIKSTPLLNGDYLSEHELRNGILQSAIVHEDYAYVPYSNGENGARAKVETKLTLVGKPKAAAAVPTAKNGGRPATLLFENPEKNPETVSLEDALKKTIATYNNGHVGPRAASQFSELIRLMRFADKDILTQTFQHVKSGHVDNNNKELARKIFLDALFRTGTAASVETTAQILSTLEERERLAAFLSFNLAKTVEKPALVHLQKLIKDPKTPKEAYLTIGNLVNKFCRKNGCEGTEIKQILATYISQLNGCKASNRNEEDRVVAILKGLRNTNHLADEAALTALIQCSQNDKLSSRVRVAAIQTFVAANCNAKVQQRAFNLLKSRNEDSEIRIEAYLAVMACPSGEVANEIKRLLDEERVYQVGSFITSHLANLRSSTDAHRESARAHFANVRSSNKFPSDVRKYSFNQELSYAINSLGIGASADSNVIYSQESFLPRSARLNVTGELFGHHFNVFEVAGRQENFDQILEHNFGPKGLLSQMNQQELYDWVRNLLQEDDVKGHHKKPASPRGRRSAVKDVEAYNAANDAKDAPKHALHDIDLDLSIKMFGSELFFLSLGNDFPTNPKDFVSAIRAEGRSLLRNAENFKKVFETHSLFLDVELVYPTGGGLPLRLNALGAGVVRFEASGNVNFKKLYANPESAEFKLKVAPSYDIELSGTLSVDTYKTVSGLQVAASIHSATAAELQFKKIEKGFDVKLNTPLQRQEIFSFTHNIVFVQADRGGRIEQEAIKFNSPRKEYGGSFDQISAHIGVTVIPKFDFTWVSPNVKTALFPLNGPNSFSLDLEVAKNYEFLVTYNADAATGAQFIQLDFDTPNSEKSRKASLRLEVGLRPKIYGRIELKNQNSAIYAEAGFKNDDKEIGFYYDTKLPSAAGPESLSYAGQIGFAKSGDRNNEILTPVINHHINGAQDVTVTGRILVDRSQKESTRYKIDNIQVTYPKNGVPITFNGNVDLSPQKYATDIQFKRDQKQARIKGGLEFGDQKPTTIELSIENDQTPDFNGKFSITYQLTEELFKNHLIFVYGKDLQSKVQRFELSQDYKFQRNAEHKERLDELSFKNKLLVPLFDFSAQLDGDYNKNLVRYLLEVTYDKTRKLGSSLEAKINEKAIGDYNVVGDIHLNENSINLKLLREILAGGTKSRLENKLSTSSGLELELNGSVGHVATDTNADVNLVGRLYIGETKDEFETTFILTLTPDAANSNGHILSNKVEIVHYDIKVQRKNAGEQNNGEFSVSVKDALTGTGQFKSNRGVGTATFAIDVPRLQRKLLIDSKFTVNDPIYEFHTDFFYDNEKDPSKKITLETKNKLTKAAVDSRNYLEILSERYEFTLTGRQEGLLYKGKQSGKFVFTLPTQRQLSGELERSTSLSQTTESTGNFKLVLKDALLAQKKERTFTVNGALKEGNLQKRTLILTHTYEYVDFNGKNLLLETEFKNVPIANTHFNKGGASVRAHGTLLPEVIDLVISVDEYCSEHAVYTMSAKYGGQFNVNTKGNFYVGSMGSGGKPTSFESSTEISVPNSKIKTVKFNSNGQLTRPEKTGDFYTATFKVGGSLNDDKLSLDTMIRSNGREGTGSFNVHLPDVDPFAVDGSYKLNKFAGDEENADDANLSGDATLNVKYGKDKSIAFKTKIQKTGTRAFDLHATLNTPYEYGRDIEVIAKHSLIKDATYQTSVSVSSKTSEKPYAFHYQSTVYQSELKPSIEILFTYPDKPQIRLFAEAGRLGDRKLIGRLQIENLLGFALDAEADVSFKSLDNFAATIAVDSEKLNLNKIKLEIKSRQAGGQSKGVEFKGTRDGKDVTSGTATFTTTDANGKFTIAGSGNIKWLDAEKAAEFKLDRHTLTEQANGESGFQVVLDASYDGKNIKGELKLTNFNIVAKFTQCENHKNCINLQIEHTFRKPVAGVLDEYKHDFLCILDLTPLEFEHKFNLKTTTELSKLVHFNHVFDIYLEKIDKTKYQYRYYVDTEKAGVELNLPKRQLAIRAVYQRPAKTIAGQYKTSIGTYVNQEQFALIDFDGQLREEADNSFAGIGEVKFVYPGVKQLRVSGNVGFGGAGKDANINLNFDLFKSPSDAIQLAASYAFTDGFRLNKFNLTGEALLRSKGFALDYSFAGHAGVSAASREYSLAGSITSPVPRLQLSLFLFGNDQKLEAIVKGLNAELVNVNLNYDRKKWTAVGEGVIRLPSTNKPTKFNYALNSIESWTFVVERDGLLKAEGKYNNGKEVSVHVYGLDKELFKGLVKLSAAEFLISEYKVNDGDVKEFLKKLEDTVRADGDEARRQLEARFDEVRTQFQQQKTKIKESIPDLSAIRQQHRKHWDELVAELKEDKKIADFVEKFNKFYQPIYEALSEIGAALAENYQKLADILTSFHDSVWQAFNERILPALKDTFAHLENIVSALYHETISLLGTFLNSAVKALKEFEADFGKIGKQFSDLFRKLSDIFNKYFDKLRADLNNVYQYVEQNIKLPELADIQSTILDLTKSDKIVKIVNEIHAWISDALPTEELKEFVTKLRDYLVNKLNKQKLDDVQILKDLYGHFVRGIRSLFDYLQNVSADLTSGLKDGASAVVKSSSKDGKFAGLSDLFGGSSADTQYLFGIPLPFSFEAFRRLPQITSFRFSPWNYVRNELRHSLHNIFSTYRPSKWNPLNLLPPFDKFGEIADGKHLFTFDGHYARFPGACKYILTQDAVNKNFTLIGHLADGKLQSLELLDRNGDSIQLEANGQIKGNDKAANLPYSRKELHTWRDYHNVYLLSTSGIEVVCTIDLTVCQLNVNGFYHGQLRGLFGNGNYEPNDDNLLPEASAAGHTEHAKNIGELANAYRLTPKTCDPITYDDEHAHERSTECSTLFGWNSGLGLCYYLFDPKNYRDACDAAVHHGGAAATTASCTVALAYAKKCRSENIFVHLPSECYQCPSGHQSREEFEESVPSGKKQADIVLAIDMAIEAATLNDLIVPIIGDLRTQLQQKGIADVHVAVIGFHDEYKYVRRFTSNGGQLDFTDKKLNLDMTQVPRERTPLVTNNEKYDAAINQTHHYYKQLVRDLGLTADARAFREAWWYPFRSGASKAIIAVRSDSLTHSVNPLKKISSLLMSDLVELQGISIHMIGPIENVKDTKSSKVIVGFNSQTVLTLQDANKKQFKPTPDLRRNLKYDADLGTEIVESNDGYIFNLNTFPKAKEERTKYTTIVAAAVADQLHRTEQKLHCECGLTRDGLYGADNCVVTESKLLPIQGKKSAPARG